MGCAQSRVDNEESVTRCRERRNLMKEAVAARNAFAAAHSGYTVALKNTGAALSDYGHGESDPTLNRVDHLPHNHHQPVESTPQPPPPPSSMDNLPPPPPPLPNFSPSPIKRAISMPAMPVKGRGRLGRADSMAIMEEDEDEDEEEGEDDLEVSRREPREEVEEATPPRTPEGVVAVKKKQKEVEEEMVTPPPPPVPDSKNLAWDYFFMVENMPGSGLDDRETEEPVENRNGIHGVEDRSIQFGNNTKNVENTGHVDAEIEPKTPERVEEDKEEDDEEEEHMDMVLRKKKGKLIIEHSNTAPPNFNRVTVKPNVPTVDLMKILDEIDDRFLKASESAQEVSKMLEATRLHYHSNFADNRGYVDHSARVMRVITWNKSFRGISNGEGGKDDLDSDEFETHATVLDKLLAWEKKLYEEVKQGELMKMEYQKKVAVLNKQKKRSATAETLEKTKAAVSHLHTRYIVDMQSMDSTSSEVIRLRDEQLYPKLVSLVDGMAKMWGHMCIHHDTQLKIVAELKPLGISDAVTETTKQHHERTRQFCSVVEEWHSQFEKLVIHQKQYIGALNSWLKLNLIPIESSLKEKISSPPRVQRPPIQSLVHSWHDHLEKLPDEVAKSAISSFAAVVKTILLHQEEEMKLKEKCEETRREFMRKNQGFEEWYQKHLQKRGPEESEAGEETNSNNHVSEKRFAVESLKKRLEDEVEAHQRHCLQVREKSLNSLKIRLPELFRAMSDYAHACADSFEKLRVITQSQKAIGGGASS